VQGLPKDFHSNRRYAFYRLRHTPELVTRVVTLLAHGCPPQAIVAAFALDERTITDWRDRASQHRQAVQGHLVERPRDLGQVQMDELRVELQGGITWVAMTLMVSTRLWLGGTVGRHLDAPLISRLVEKVRACASALTLGLLLCRDGLKCYIGAIRMVFREAVPSGQTGRPRLHSWKNIFLAQSVKQYEQGRMVGIDRHILAGTETDLERMLEQPQGGGVINTAFIERLNVTFRQGLSSLVRRGRGLARQSRTLEMDMYLVGTIYNFCWEHQSLRLPGLKRSRLAPHRRNVQPQRPVEAFKQRDGDLFQRH
jgi:hypothetical protein